MSEIDPIDAYVNEFFRHLPGRSRRARRALREIEDHLRERTEALCRNGMESLVAAEAAIERFGAPSEVMRQFELQAPLESEVMMRYVLTLLATLTSAFAALMFVFSWLDDASAAGLIAKIGLSCMIIGYNAILLLRLWTQKSRTAWAHWFIFGGAMLMIAVGSAGFVWTAHLGRITGDWESYGFVVATLLVFEGVLAAVQAMAHESNVAKLTT